MNTNTIVTPDGHIGMLFARQLKVAGLTMAEAGELIESVLSEYIVDPRVGVTPVEINSETLTLAGGVSNPGVYPVSNGMRLADLYAMAGGSAARYFDGQVLEVADLVNSRFIRDGKLLPVDFRKAIEDGDMLNNILLRKGDYVYIAVRTESLVCLIGDVANPHKRMWDNNLGLLELLTTGGWVHETYWPYVIIIRGGVANPTLYKVDLDGILQGRCPNIYLDPGDVVYVPHDNISEYNVFIRKVLPTGSLVNLLLSPRGWFK